MIIGIDYGYFGLGVLDWSTDPNNYKLLYNLSSLKKSVNDFLFSCVYMYMYMYLFSY